MSNLVYTVYANHPRSLWRDTETSSIIARSNDTWGWKLIYDNYIYTQAGVYANTATATIATDSTARHIKALTLILRGVCESSSTHKDKAIDVALYYAQNLASSETGTDGRRTGAMLQAFVFDCLYADLTTEQRNTLITGLHTTGGKCLQTSPYDSYIAGHTPGHNACAFLCGLVLSGHDSYSTTLMDGAFDYWYGASQGDDWAMDVHRYFSQKGGSGKGTAYTLSSHWYTFLLIHWMSKGFTSTTFNGVSYDVLVDEDWVEKVPEWYLHTMIRGDKDFLALGDGSRLTNPVFDEKASVAIAFLAEHGDSDWRSIMHWLWDQKWAWAGAQSSDQRYGYLAALPFALWDKGNVSYPSTAPKDATTVPDRAKFFKPPGAYHYVHPTWDIGNNCDVLIYGPEYDYRQHTHRDVGSIQIGILDDRVLLKTGLYNTSDTAAQYQGTHNNNWQKQSISASGVVLVEGLASDESDRHYQRDENGAKQTYYNGLGGQCWKTIGGYSGTWDPDAISELVYDGGGQGWRRALMSVPTESDAADFVVIDGRRAYLKEYTDYDGSTERVRVAKYKHLVLKQIAPWPVIFRVAYIQSRLASMKKRDQWHFHTQPILESNKRFGAHGYRGTGRILIHYYDPTQYTYTIVGGGVETGGIGEFDCYWDGTNWRPTGSVSSRWAPDFGHYRMEVSPGSPTTDNWFTCLLMPMAAGESPPTYEWFEETSYFGVRFGTAEYRIHKTLDQCIIGSTDTQPPGRPSGVTATGGPGSGNVTVSWNPNTEEDMGKYHVYYRAQS